MLKAFLSPLVKCFPNQRKNKPRWNFAGSIPKDSFGQRNGKFFDLVIFPMLYRRLFLRGKGSILILTLLVLTVLSVLSLNLGFAIRQKLNFLQHVETNNKLHFIAEAGVKKAILELKKEHIILKNFYHLNEFWSNNPIAFKEIQVGDGAFTVGYIINNNFYVDSVAKNEFDSGETPLMQYGLVDENSKINLNNSDMEVFKRLFQNVVFLSDELAEELAYCIIDWKDEDSNFQHPSYGAEDSYYRNLEYPYEAKDSDYEILEELLLVKGMNKEIFDKIKDYVTIYGQGTININTASAEVLSALGLSDGLIEKIMSFRYGMDSELATFDDSFFTSASKIITQLKSVVPLNSSEIMQLEILISKDKLDVTSENFMVKSAAKLDKKNLDYQIIAVVDSEGKIKYWQEE